MEDAAVAESQFSVVVRRLNKSYGQMKAVDNISFRIEKGEILGFLGPNGAGKSTTMRILSGLMAADSGSAYICGVSVANRPGLAQRHIGYMPENNPLPEDVRVVEYLRFRARIKGIAHSRVRSAVDEAMEVCRIHRKASRKIIGNLSKGFKQRVGIADALLANPDVVIMDEPTIGLDPHQIIAIRELINSLRGRMSVVISSHILPEIEQVCDRVMIINNGRIVASGTPEHLRQEFVPFAGYEVRVCAAEADLAPKIAAIGRGLSIESHGPHDADGFATFTLKTPEKEDLGEFIVAGLAGDNGLRLSGVRRLRPSLEDIFMIATRNSWDETLNTGGK